LVQLAGNAAGGPLNATVVDRVPANRIGGISTVTGVIAYVGAIGGSVVAGSLFAAIGLAAYFPIAVVLVLAALSFVAVRPRLVIPGLWPPHRSVVRTFFHLVRACPSVTGTSGGRGSRMVPAVHRVRHRQRLHGLHAAELRDAGAVGDAGGADGAADPARPACPPR